MATSSGWSLTGRLITKHLGALGTTIAGMIANFDPETATEADRDALAARLRDIAGRHAKAKAEWQKEEADVVALRKQIATDTDVAAKLGERLAAGTVTEDAVNLFLDELQAAQDRLPQEEAEAQDAKAFLDELQALVAQMSEQLAQFDAHATKVKRELERAKAAHEQQALRAQQQEELRAMAGKGGASSGLSALQARAAKLQAQTEGLRVVNDVTDRPIQNKKAVDELRQSVLNGTTAGAKPSAAERLAQFTKTGA